MAKKKEPPQPEKLLHLSRRLCWAQSKKEGRWMVMWDKTQFCFSAGTPDPRRRVNRQDHPESIFNFRLQFWRPQLVAFWRCKRIICLGDKPWKSFKND